MQRKTGRQDCGENIAVGFSATKRRKAETDKALLRGGYGKEIRSYWTNSNKGKLATLDMAKADENLHVKKIAKTVDVGDSNNEMKLADDPIYLKSRHPQEQLGLIKRTPGANNYRKRSAKLVYADEQMEEFLVQLSASEEENAKIVKD